MTIEQMINEGLVTVRNGEIHLGTQNGWGAKTLVAYKALNEIRVPNTGTSRNLGRCYNEYSFTVNDGTNEYVVVYSVDSSD